MKIAYLITTRYPTTKAYGVTIGNSCFSLRMLGHEVEIFAASDFSSDDYGNPITNYSSNLEWIRNSYHKNNLASKLTFTLWNIYSALKLLSVKKIRNFNVIYTRDPLVVLMFGLFTKKKIIVEIHQKPRILLLIALNIIKRNIYVFVILNHQQRFVKRYFKGKINILPMGVPDNIHNLSHLEKQRKTICYLGNYLSSGQSNGVEKLILDFANLLKYDNQFKLILIGIDDDIDSISILVKKYSLQEKVLFVNHLSHKKAIEESAKYEYGVIPYPNSNYNQNRFPIKLVEYSAIGQILLVSNLETYQNILPKNQAIFYEQAAELDLAKKVIALEAQPNLKLNMVKRSVKWSQEFTYSKRMKILLKSLGE